MNRILIFLLAITVSSCASLKLSTGGVHYDPIYGTEVVLEVPSDVEIDTLSYSQLKWKLRTDSRFRYDFAQYAMDQPYSWYMTNYSFNYWRPYNSFDIYWNRFQFWNDWAFNYPFNYGWGWNNHNYGWYSWNRPYRPWNTWFNGPWSNPGYNVIWNSSRENSIAYINGPRSSRGIINNNIEDNIVTRYKKGRNSRTIDNSNENSILNTIVSNLRDKFANVRIYNNPNNVPLNNNINNNRPIIINNTKPINNNNNNSKPTWNSKPSYNSFNSSNSSRGGSVNSNSGGASRGNNNSVSGGRSGGSSKGGNSNGNN